MGSDITDHPLGPIIAETTDSLGKVRVHERDGLRFLAFGNLVQQSSMRLERPEQLQHAYTQAMMVGVALLPSAGSALVLGLGGGDLVRALHAFKPELAITAVEYRKSVIRLAKEYFGLAGIKGTRLLHADAEDFVTEHDGHFDLIMADLYLNDAVNPAQRDATFVSHCQNLLSAKGILILNLWCEDYATSRDTRWLLEEIFAGQTWHVLVEGGNHIAFCFADKVPDLDRKVFFERARRIGAGLGIPLERFARMVWGQN
ncbi:MAG: methyltransferase domain-containing protein [Gammaproteobacteria bacterium]